MKKENSNAKAFNFQAPWLFNRQPTETDLLYREDTGKNYAAKNIGDKLLGFGSGSVESGTFLARSAQG
jgi:hypothetical protein